ncbi:MAG: TIGR03067 domain-containing protein [Planctomycetes bacterium]|nr:TIGR03067 domain-containing protein [Planctomycetota bacterium]
MRITYGIFLLGAVLALATGCGSSGSTTAPAPSLNIEGTYLITGTESAGVKDSEEAIAKTPAEERTIQVTADRMVVKKDGKDEPATYQLDATKTPVSIDMIGKKDGKEERLYGIVKVEGDKLFLCFNASSKIEDRPKEFKTAPKEKTMILTLTKQK